MRFALPGLRRKATEVGLSCSVRPAPDVVSTAQGEHTVLLDVRQGKYFGVDAVGGRIWELIEQGGPVSAIVDRLQAEYDAPRERLEADTVTFVSSLVASGLASIDA